MGYIIAAILLVATALFWFAAFAWRIFRNPAPVRYDDHYVSRLIHGLVIASLLAITLPAASYQLGRDVQRHYDAAYFAQKYSVSHEVAPPRPGSSPVAVKAVSVPLSAENKTLLPAVGNQGTTGACAAWSSTYYTASYEWRKNHPGSWLKFAPRFTYSRYSDTYSGGADLGSNVTRDLEISATLGIPRFKQYPYGSTATALGLPQYGIDNPIPSWVMPLAVQHRFVSTLTALSSYQQGAGPGLIGEIENAIANGKLVMIATPVPPAFDAASINPYIYFTTQDGSRGYHEITFYGYKIDASAPGGAWFHFRNSWSTAYGVNGDAWYSAYDVATFTFDAETLAIS